MKYYLYISDTKVDMLYEQIPSQLRETISGNLKIDLKLLSATISKEVIEKTKFDKLSIVCNYLEKQKMIGTVNEPNEFFKGTLSMRWGSLDTDYDSAEDERYGISRKFSFDPKKVKTVYFGGVTKKTILGLAGSEHHLLGATRETKQEHLPSSFVPYILSALQIDMMLSPTQKFIWDDQIPGLSRSEDFAFDAIAFTVRNMKTPPQKLEFVAKRLLYKKFPKQEFGNEALGSLYLGVHNQILLGSPIYVAISE